LKRPVAKTEVARLIEREVAARRKRAEAGPWPLPGVGFGCGSAGAGEDLVEGGEGGLVEGEVQGGKR